MENNYPPIAEVIAIGDEITSGAKLDTNSQWLSVQLGSLGIRVLYHSTVGDSLEACTNVFRLAARRASIIVTTGGLGPTADDLTRQALADAIASSLEFNPQAMAHIEAIFKYRNREMPERNRVQAMFPRGSQVIPNPQGTAPGIDLLMHQPVLIAADQAAQRTSSQMTQSLAEDSTEQPARLFALPGVPVEMRSMYEDTVRPRLIEHLNIRHAIERAVIKCFGLGESEMEARLAGMIARQRTPQVGITVHRATISLRIEAHAETSEAATAQIEQARETVHRLAGNYVFGEGENFELQHAVKQALANWNESVVVVEIGHAAVIAGWLAALEAPETYLGGFSFPTRELALARLLPSTSQVSPSADPLSGPDAAQRAEAMLQQQALQIGQAARQHLQADYCIVVDSYPTLTPPAGQVLPAAPVRFAVAGPTEEDSLCVTEVLGGHPEILQDRIAKAALFELLTQLRRKQLLVGDSVSIL